jgi:hypothetical protein
MFARYAVLFAGAVSILIAGCGDGRPKRVPVAGQVLIDGKPLTTGSVQFVPEGGRPSQGEIDASGRFRLTCYEKDDGALVGTHRVAIISAKELSPYEVRWFTPKKFADFKTSGITKEITGPTEDLVIEISWEGGKEFTESVQGSGGAEGTHGKRFQKAADAN